MPHGQVMKASDLLSESRKIEPNPDKGIDLHSNGLISLLLGFFMAIRGRRAEACSALTEVSGDAAAVAGLHVPTSCPNCLIAAHVWALSCI